MEDIMYDPILEQFRYDYYLRAAIMNEQFNEWYNRMNGIYTEEPLLEASQEWYNEWKITYISGIKANLSRFRLYLKSQNGKNSRWLAENKNLMLDYHKYPPKNNESIKSAPNFRVAISRLNKPISSSLNGINLSRVILNQGKSSDNDRVNMWVKKLMIPEYDASKGTFVSFAKDYYCGNDSKVKISVGSIPQVLEMGFNYCFNFNTMLRAIQVESNGIISYINNDPLSGNQEQPTSIVNNSPQQGGMASTNPNINANNTPVNAAYDQYASFMKEFFNEDITQSNQASTSPTANTNYNTNVVKSNNPIKSKISTMMNKSNNPTKKDDKIKESDIYKKKRFVCDIIRDALNAKMTAYGVLYKNFMDILQTHVNNYSKSNKTSINR